MDAKSSMFFRPKMKKSSQMIKYNASQFQFIN